MRRSHTLAIGALVVLLAVPEGADARSRFSRGIIGLATAPVRAVARVAGLSGPRYRHSRRAATARAYAPAVAAAPAATRMAAAERPATEETAEPNRVQRAARPSTPAQSVNAYEDLIGYALWPDDYAARFWARGYGDIMRAMVSGTGATAAVTEERSSRRTRARAKASETDVTSVAATGMCAAQTDEEAGKPVERISQAIELTDVQKASLTELRAAVREAVKRGKAACLDALPPTPAGRIKTTTDGLWAMRDADILLRTPLVNFYATLTDAQRAQLSRSPAVGGNGGTDGNGDNGDSKDKSARTNAEACSLAGNDLPVEAIERLVQPSAEQRGSLEMVKGMSAEMSGYLAASCPREAPADPVARLDAAGNRLNAMLYAVMLFDQALNGFYLQLSDDQKNRFDGVRR